MKTVIILSFSFLMLTLVGCGKKVDKQTSEEKCENKGENYVYNVYGKGQCLTKAEKECKDKGEEYLWNASANTCDKKPLTQAECEASQGYKWENNQCVGVEQKQVQSINNTQYTVLFKSYQPRSSHVVLVESGESESLTKKSLLINGCVVITESQAQSLKISVKDSSTQTQKILCDHASNVDSEKCELKNYEVIYNPRGAVSVPTPVSPGRPIAVPVGGVGYELKEAQSASENCKALGTK